MANHCWTDIKILKKVAVNNNLLNTLTYKESRNLGLFILFQKRSISWTYWKSKVIDSSYNHGNPLP